MLRREVALAKRHRQRVVIGWLATHLISDRMRVAGIGRLRGRTRCRLYPRSCMANRAKRDSINGLGEVIEVNRFDQVHVEARLS